MATFRKSKTGWRAEVARRGVRKSASFPTKQEARDWAARQEHLILAGDGATSRVKFADVLLKYASDVSPTKRGERWEVLRLKRFAADPIGKIALARLTSLELARWRDRRLGEVSPGTVIREMNLLSGVLTVARREWGMLAVNPMAEVRRPRAPASRDRLATDREIELLALSAGDDTSNATARAFHAFLFAIETAMRAGEVVDLTWEHVDLDRKVAHLPRTKNGTARDVPLSGRALEILRGLPNSDPVFGLSKAQRDALWRKLRDRAGVEGLRFHDSRHTAITRLSRKLDVLDLARMVGHRDIRMLMVYYHPDPSELADLLG